MLPRMKPKSQNRTNLDFRLPRCPHQLVLEPPEEDGLLVAIDVGDVVAGDGPVLRMSFACNREASSYLSKIKKVQLQHKISA